MRTRTKIARRDVLGLIGGLTLGALFPRSVAALTEEAQRDRLLFETRENEARLADRGFLAGDARLDAYLQSVMNRLYPDNKFRVRAIKDLDANAFAVATGNVYVHTGLLLRVRNEAELAAILGHEGAHVLGDHAYKGIREAKNLGVLVATVPLVGLVAGLTSMAGYSRDLEREADRVGLQRMLVAGYDPTAAAPLFERMAAEIEARKIKQPPYFFADHPKLLERVQNFREFAGDQKTGIVSVDEYDFATHTMQQQSLDLIHERKDGATLICLLADPGRTTLFSPSGNFLLGEGYRFRNAPGDAELAIAAYTQSTIEHPDFAGVYGARARLRAKQGDNAGALEDLEEFIRLAPDSREAGFARQTIERLRKEINP